jgi:FixJ family two-component response regulator
MKNEGIVAVVDDDRAVLQSLESLLESVGYIVRLFASAEALLASDSVSLTICVISDIGMPGMNGIALKALLLQRYPDLPVILITGNQELAQLRELKEREPPYFFEKPFDGKTLVAAIRQVCGKTNKGTAD